MQSIESQPMFWSKPEALLAISFHSGIMFSLFFDPEDGGNMFLRKIG
jgi:hypothetical protein